MTGGGHSSLSTSLGLGVDNVLEVETVLPNGTYITANRCQNQEIFFALRGGGAHAFGINMKVTAKAHPELKSRVSFVSSQFTISGILTHTDICIRRNSNKPGHIQRNYSHYHC
jgi:FAD/FMN-containing dehydrogenase